MIDWNNTALLVGAIVLFVVLLLALWHQHKVVRKVEEMKAEQAKAAALQVTNMQKLANFVSAKLDDALYVKTPRFQAPVLKPDLPAVVPAAMAGKPDGHDAAKHDDRPAEKAGDHEEHTHA